MKAQSATVSLYVLNILWGMLLGVVFYAHLTIYPSTLANLPETARMVDSLGWSDARFWMTWHPLLLVTWIVTLTLNWKSESRRRLLGISLGIYIAVIAATSIYFLPELAAFNTSPASDVSPAEWAVRTQAWQRWSWVREAVMHVPQVLLLMALRRSAPVSEKAAREALVSSSA